MTDEQSTGAPGWVWRGYERWERGHRVIDKVGPGLFSATLRRGFRGDVVDTTLYGSPLEAMTAADRLT